MPLFCIILFQEAAQLLNFCLIRFYINLPIKVKILFTQSFHTTVIMGKLTITPISQMQ